MPPRHERTPKPFSWQPIAVVLFVVVMGICFWMWIHRITSLGSVGVGLFLIPALTLLSVPIFVRAAKETRFDLSGLLAVALMLRFLFCFYRFDHAADGGVYVLHGNVLAQSFRNLNFGVDTGAPFPGTGGLRYIAGLVATITNTSAFAEFLVFTWLGFIGCFLLYRAFVTAMPDADHHRYALLLFLWPTVAFWPSSVGKDCWLLFTLGIGAIGAARVFVRRPGGYTLMIIGLLLGSIVRPHVALIELVAFAFALLIGRRVNTRPGAITPSSVAKVAGLILMLVIGAVLVNRTADLLAANDINASVDAALNTSTSRTSQGGSQFNPSDPRTPVGYGIATITILVRPFPFEAHALDQLIVALEGLFLIVLAAVSWRRLLTLPRRLRSDPYVTMSLIFILMFIFALGTVSNFGILARQRSQLMPFVFVPLCVTALVSKPQVDTRKR